MTSLQRAISDAMVEFGSRAVNRYPIYLAVPAGEQVMAAEDMLAPGTLREFLARAGAVWGADSNIVAASSRFMRRYCGSMASAALIPLSHGLAIDVSIPRLSFLIREEMPMGVVLDTGPGQVATSRQRPSSWPLEGDVLPSYEAVRERALYSLFAANIVPAFQRVNEEVNLSRRLMWTTAAEQIDVLYESALNTCEAGRRTLLVRDREFILHNEQLPGVAGPNPLRGLLEWGEPTNTRAGRVIKRKYCCVNYVVPGRFGANDPHCASCPLLTPEQREAVIREQSGVG